MTKELLQQANAIQNKIDNLRESYELVLRCTNKAGCFVQIPNDLFLQQAVAKVIFDRIEELEKELEEL